MKTSAVPPPFPTLAEEDTEDEVQRLPLPQQQQQKQDSNSKKPLPLTMTTAATKEQIIRRMNNVGATSIELGKFDEAIVKLTEASLKLLGIDNNVQNHDSGCQENNDEKQNNDQQQDEFLLKPYLSVNNNSSVVDDFVRWSKEYVPPNNVAHLSKKESKSTHEEGTIVGDSSSSSSSSSLSLLYHKTPVRIFVLRPTKNDLFLIVTFNLSLAYHLKLIDHQMLSKSGNSSSGIEESRQRFEKMVQNTIRLYEQLLPSKGSLVKEEIQNNGSYKKNPLFLTIVRNNLDHLKEIQRPCYNNNNGLAGCSSGICRHMQLLLLLGSSFLPIQSHHPSTTTVDPTTTDKDIWEEDGDHRNDDELLDPTFIIPMIIGVGKRIFSNSAKKKRDTCTLIEIEKQQESFRSMHTNHTTNAGGGRQKIEIAQQPLSFKKKKKKEEEVESHLRKLKSFLKEKGTTVSFIR